MFDTVFVVICSILFLILIALSIWIIIDVHSLKKREDDTTYKMKQMMYRSDVNEENQLRDMRSLMSSEDKNINNRISNISTDMDNRFTRTHADIDARFKQTSKDTLQNYVPRSTLIFVLYQIYADIGKFFEMMYEDIFNAFTKTKVYIDETQEETMQHIQRVSNDHKQSLQSTSEEMRSEIYKTNNNLGTATTAFNTSISNMGNRFETNQVVVGTNVLDKNKITLTGNLNNQGPANFTNSVSSTRGLEVLNHNPGPLIQKSYGNGDRYGIGQFSNGRMRVYAAGAFAPATVGMSMTRSDGTFSDIVVADNKNMVTINGTLRVCDTMGLNCKNVALQ